MSILVQITLLPHKQEDESYILDLAFDKAKLRMADISDWRIRKRSIDARKSPVKLNEGFDALPSKVQSEIKSGMKMKKGPFKMKKAPMKLKYKK